MTTEQQHAYLDEHLPYELGMLRYTYKQMRQKQHYLSWNVHLESFAIHARNIINFLTNKDDGNFKAMDFVRDYRARIGDQSGAKLKLEKQVFHLAKTRPKDPVGKCDTEHAKAVFDWIEKNFNNFLSKLPSDLKDLFDEKKSDPTNDEALDPAGPVLSQPTTTVSSTEIISFDPLADAQAQEAGRP